MCVGAFCPDKHTTRFPCGCVLDRYVMHSIESIDYPVPWANLLQIQIAKWMRYTKIVWSSFYFRKYFFICWILTSIICNRFSLSLLVVLLFYGLNFLLILMYFSTYVMYLLRRWRNLTWRWRNSRVICIIKF